jgi:sugar phosphate permease
MRSMSPPTRVRWAVVLPLILAASFLLYVHRYAWGVVRPDLKTAYPELTDLDLGWLDALFLASYALTQVPAGWLGDRFGARATLPLMALAWSACVAGFALVPGTFVALALVRVLFGVAQAGAYPLLSKLTRSWFPVQVRASVQGTVTAMGRLGGAAAALVIATLLVGAAGLTWPAALVAVSLPGIILAVALAAMLRDSASTHPWANAAERALVPADPTPAAGRSGLRVVPAARLTFGLMLGYAFLSTFADGFFVNWLTQYFRRGHGASPAAAGVWVTAVLMAGAAGSVFGGVLNDALLPRLGKRVARPAVALTGKLLSSVLIAVLAVSGQFALSDPFAVAVGLLILAKFFTDWSVSTQWASITDTAGRSAATVFGIVNTVGAAGGFVAGPVMAMLEKTYGWAGLFASVTVVNALAAACWPLIDTTRPLAGDPPPEPRS